MRRDKTIDRKRVECIISENGIKSKVTKKFKAAAIANLNYKLPAAEVMDLCRQKNSWFIYERKNDKRIINQCVK